MSSGPAIPSLGGTVTVGVPVAQAFQVFTRSFDTWWDRLVFTWQINGQWQFDADPEHASEVEVHFTADGPDQTTVTVEHRYLERLVGGQTIHDEIKRGGSWPSLLDSYAKVVANQQ